MITTIKAYSRRRGFRSPAVPVCRKRLGAVRDQSAGVWGGTNRESSVPLECVRGSRSEISRPISTVDPYRLLECWVLIKEFPQHVLQ